MPKANAKARNSSNNAKSKARKVETAKPETAKLETKARRSKAVATKAEARKASKATKARTASKRETAKRDYQPKPGTGLEIADNQRITLKVKGNPKRKGSASYDRFQLYFTKKPKTVADAIEAGITRADVRWDAGQGFIELK